jgi:hypothetical protein
MIINNLYFVGVTFFPTETDAPLVVNANAVLPPTIALQRLQVIAGRNPQIVEHSSAMEVEKLATRRTFDGTESWDRNVVEKFFCVLTPEGLDH